MLRIKRILCPVDFSEFASKALDYACSLARHYEAKLYLQHIVEPIGTPYFQVPEPTIMDIYLDLSKEAEKKLQDMIGKHASNGCEPELAVHRGYAPEAILSFAESQSIDLIVMGTHGRQGFSRLIMGSVTQRVLRNAKCPVLAVRKPEYGFVDPRKPEEAVEPRKLIFCTDFSANSSAALEYALSIAQEYHAELTLLHVIEEFPGAELPSRSDEIEQKLLSAVPREAFDWCTIRPRVRFGKPYQEIIQLAVEDRVDLVVMGVHGRNTIDMAVFGSTTNRVIQLGPCPILSVPLRQAAP